MILCVSREGRSNAHVKGDYQRIGDVMLRNMSALKVRPHQQSGHYICRLQTRL